MADRVITWHIPDNANAISLPRYYMDADYEKVALRIYAEVAPTQGDFSLDIQADGVSIFNNQPTYTFTTAGQRSEIPTVTPVVNTNENDNADDEGADMNGELIPQGSWLAVTKVDLKGSRGISINLLLNKIDENESA